MPTTEATQKRWLAMAEAVETDEGMTSLLLSLGTDEAAVAQSLARNDSAALSAAMAGTSGWSPLPDQIRVPSLWYTGSEESPALSAEVLELASRVGAETHVIPGASHVQAFRRADDVLRTVRPFLDRHAHNAN